MLWGAKYLHTRDIGKLKICVHYFFFVGGGHLGGTEILWEGRHMPPPPRPPPPVATPLVWYKISTVIYHWCITTIVTFILYVRLAVSSSSWYFASYDRNIHMNRYSNQMKVHNRVATFYNEVRSIWKITTDSTIVWRFNLGRVNKLSDVEQCSGEFPGYGRCS